MRQVPDAAMLICLDRKRLEAAVIDRPSARTVVMCIPALGMRHGDPLPIQHVIGEVTGGQARTTGHALVERMPAAVSRNDSRPLFFVPQAPGALLLAL